MAVLVITQYRSNPGKGQQLQLTLKKTIQHLQRMGGSRVHFAQAIVAGSDTGIKRIALEFSDLNAFARWHQQAGHDQQWQQHLAQGTPLAKGEAELVTRFLCVELGASSGLLQQAVGGILLASMYQPAPGKLQEAHQLASRSRELVQRAGAHVSQWQLLVGGQSTGNLLAVGQEVDMNAFTATQDKLTQDHDWQELEAEVQSGSSLRLSSRALWSALPTEG